MQWFFIETLTSLLGSWLELVEFHRCRRCYYGVADAMAKR